MFIIVCQFFSESTVCSDNLTLLWAKLIDRCSYSICIRFIFKVDTLLVENDITPDILQQLDDSYLKELVPSVGTRIKLRERIKKYVMVWSHYIVFVQRAKIITKYFRN